MMRKKVAMGLSGGVDSAVSAALLVEQGYEVTGVFLECWRAPGCKVDEDRKDAMDVARKLGIGLTVLDFKKEYKEKVVDYFFREYKAGRTPNPDTMCNREIKFGMFYEWAMKNGFDAVATGHYACVSERGVRHRLLMGKDERKDQSYFLYQLRKEQLGQILFPIGEMSKGEVRQKAKKLGLSVAGKPDSQGICFIGPVSVVEFLKELGMKEQAGRVVLKIKNNKSQAANKIKTINNKDTGLDSLAKPQNDRDLVEVGKHKGAWFYTVGQRHGFRIQDLRFGSEEQKTMFEEQYDLSKMPALYVVQKDVERNVLIVGTRDQVMRREFEVSEVHWVNDKILNQVWDDRKVRVRIRHGGSLVRAVVSGQNSGVRVRLDEPVFGVAAGQACVFYDDDVVLGGGVIV